MPASTKQEVEELVSKYLGEFPESEVGRLTLDAKSTLDAAKRCDLGNAMGSYATLWGTLNAMSTRLHQAKPKEAAEKLSRAATTFVVVIEDRLVDELVSTCSCKNVPLKEPERR